MCSTEHAQVYFVRVQSTPVYVLYYTAACYNCTIVFDMLLCSTEHAQVYFVRVQSTPVYVLYYTAACYNCTIVFDMLLCSTEHAQVYFVRRTKYTCACSVLHSGLLQL